MKAVQITGYGNIENNVRLTNTETPNINDDEVLIEVHSAGVNPLDVKVIKGALKRISKLKFPAILGYDVSGKIIAKGKNVTQFSIGDKVFSRVKKQGTFTEQIAVHQNLIALMPNNTTFVESASLPLVGLTAIQVLKKGNLKKGDTVLIHAGSGGVGSFAIQYAKHIGAKVFTTTSSKNVNWVKALGADRVINYEKEDYKTIVTNADLVLDTLGGSYTEDAFKVIKKGGRVVTLVGIIDEKMAVKMRLPLPFRWILSWQRRKITKQQKAKSASYHSVFMRPNAQQLNRIKELVEANVIKPIIDRTFSLSEAKEALQYVNRGKTKGKVVLVVK